MTTALTGNDDTGDAGTNDKLEGEGGDNKLEDGQVSRDTLNDGDKSDEGKEGDDGEKKTGDDADAAPESYEEFVLPEGLEVDTDLSEKFTEVAKDLNLTQEQAQKLVDLQTSQLVENAEKAAAAAEQYWTDIKNEWVEAGKGDEEIGGAKYEEATRDAKVFLSKFGNEALEEALEFTGVGDHPEFIRVFAAAGKAMKEDKLHSGSGGSDAPKSLAERMFPNHGKA